MYSTYKNIQDSTLLQEERAAVKDRMTVTKSESKGGGFIRFGSLELHRGQQQVKAKNPKRKEILLKSQISKSTKHASWLWNDCFTNTRNH